MHEFKGGREEGRKWGRGGEGVGWRKRKQRWRLWGMPSFIRGIYLEAKHTFLHTHTYSIHPLSYTTHLSLTIYIAGWLFPFFLMVYFALKKPYYAFWGVLHICFAQGLLSWKAHGTDNTAPEVPEMPHQLFSLYLHNFVTSPRHTLHNARLTGRLARPWAEL